MRRIAKGMYRLLLMVLAACSLWMGTVSAEREFWSDYIQAKYDYGTGLLSNEANCVIQTLDGYIWVGTYAGLLRYDGQSFQLMKGSDRKDISRVRTLFEDSRQRLWIGTNNSGLLVSEQGTIHRDVREDGMVIRAVTEGKDGDIYVASSDGLNVLQPDGGSHHVEDSRLQCLIISLSVSPDGTVWGVTFRGEVFALADGVVQAFYTEQELGQECISVFSTRDGRIFAGTTGSAILQLQEGAIRPFFTGARTNVTSMYEDQSGLLWICSDRGIGCFDQEMNYRETDGTVLNTSIENIWEDYEKNYWLTSSRQGLLHLIRSKFRNITFAGNMPGTVYNAVARMDDRLYMGSDNGLYLLDAAYQPLATSLTQALQGIRIRDLMPDRQGRLWIASYRKYGAICLSPDGSWRSWTSLNGMPSEKVRVFLERSNGDIVIGTGAGLAVLRDDQIVRTYTDRDGLVNSVILSLAEDQEGCLLAGTDGDGIYQIRADGALNHIDKADDGTKLGVILRMCRDDANSGIWITNGSGIYFLSAAGLKMLAPADMDLTNVFDIRRIGTKLWLMQASGIYVLEAEDLLDTDQPDYQFLKCADTMQSTITANARSFLTDTGYLYLACTRGVLGIDSGNIYNNYMPPKIALTELQTDEFTVNGKTYQPGETVVLPSDTSRITIKFAVLSFADKDVDIEYCMEGFDRKPTIVEGRNVIEATYTNLHGGAYEFYIDAMNGDGVAADKRLVLHIQKEYGLLERPLIQLACLLLAAALLVLAVRFYMRRKVELAVARQKEYQAITTQAINAIANTIDAKDKYTRGHSQRVAQYAREIARELGWSENDIEGVYYTALLHDIGKIGIPDEILCKPGHLTDEEYEVIKTHTGIGCHILSNMDVIPYIREGAHYHHERYDGSGYPEGLKGEEIPEIARVICVADSFDAMYSARVYRQGMSLDYIREELRRCAGTQFDPKIVVMMLRVLDRGFRASYEEKGPDGES